MKKMTFNKTKLNQIFKLYERFNENDFPCIYIDFNHKHIQVCPITDYQNSDKVAEAMQRYGLPSEWVVHPSRTTKALKNMECNFLLQ